MDEAKDEAENEACNYFPLSLCDNLRVGNTLACMMIIEEKQIDLSNPYIAGSGFGLVT
jgi:hypothetical protein